MKNLRTYHQLFERLQELTSDQMKWLDECTSASIGKWNLNSKTGLVDVQGVFYCSKKGLTDFKGVRFGVISGSFRCSDNRLTTLEGAPQKVEGDFDCYENQLTSLVGAPQEVIGDFSCHSNMLTSLEGAPQIVGDAFYCGFNQLTSLEGAPQEVGGSFHCEYNKLTSLEGAPKSIIGGFFCKENPVSEETLRTIFRIMKEGNSYLQSVESIWSEISLEDQVLLYRPEFDWVSSDERRKIEAVRAYHGFKGML